jgi:hypothetical protein
MTVTSSRRQDKRVENPYLRDLDAHPIHCCRQPQLDLRIGTWRLVDCQKWNLRFHRRLEREEVITPWMIYDYM